MHSKEQKDLHVDQSEQTLKFMESVRQLRPTNFDGEARRQTKSDEVAQLGKVCIWDSHEVNDGRHLLRQGQRVALA